MENKIESRAGAGIAVGLAIALLVSLGRYNIAIGTSMAEAIAGIGVWWGQQSRMSEGIGQN